LIVVIAIIAVLAAILIPILLNWVTSSNISAANGDAKVVFNAIASEITRRDTTSQVPIPGTTGTGVTNPVALPTTGTAGTPGIANSTFYGSIVPEHLAQMPSASAIQCWFDNRGAIIAVLVNRSASNPQTTFVAGAANGGWSGGEPQRRGNIYGTFPEFRPTAAT
jgi:type II secretory pathway pseudopilin PulG